MNEFFDPNDERHDTDMATLLQTLPAAPDHADDFWASLDSELDEVDASTAERHHRTPRQTGLHGRTQFMLVAAALVMVAGAIGIAVNNQAEDEITTADAPEVVSDGPLDENDAPALTTTTAPDAGEIVTDDPLAGDRPFVNTDGTTTFGEAGGYYVDERFAYDLLVPDGFQSEFPSVYGAYFTSDVDPAAASISTTHLFAGDSVPDWVSEPSDGETLTNSGTVEMPLFTSINDSVEEAGTFDVDQFVFERDGGGQRIVRLVQRENRIVVIEIVELADGLFPDGAAAVFDRFRFYDDPEWISDCSSSGLPALSAPAELNAAQGARYEAIMEALTSCDLPLLGEQVNPQEFFANIASDPALPLWTRQEQFGEPILRTLYDFMALPVGIDADSGEAQWPRGWSTAEGPDDETVELLIAGGYVTEAELPSWDEIGYANWRLAIDADGNWNYFLVGD